MRAQLWRVCFNFVYHPLFWLISVVLVPLLVCWILVQMPFVSRRTLMRRVRMIIKVYGFSVIYAARPWVRYDVPKPDLKLDGPCIYICNHRSGSDPFLLAFLPGEIAQVVASWPMRIPVVGLLARLAGYLPVSDLPVDEFFRRARKLIEEGTHIGGFPEGTRSGSPIMGPFHGALFRLALDMQVPIVPVCIAGNEHLPPKGRLWMEPGVIRIRALDPMLYDDYGAFTPFQLKRVVRDRIETELERLDAMT